MTDITPEEVSGLVDQLKGLSLEPRQRELLDGILQVAGDIQEGSEEPAFAKEFSKAFTKKQADLVFEYIAAAPAHVNAIIRSFPAATPPIIIRVPPTNPDDDD